MQNYSAIYGNSSVPESTQPQSVKRFTARYFPVEVRKIDKVAGR